METNIISSNETASYTLEADPVVVVCAADNNYSMPLAVTIRSAMENFNSSRKLLWFVMDGGITEHNKSRILKSMKPEMLASGQCEIRWLPKPEVFDDKVVLSDRMPSAQALPNATFYRLILPDILPSEFKKAIYMDCDVAINGNLEKLWETDIGDNYILATRNAYSRTISDPDAGLLNWKELGFSADDKKFAAGVVVLNLEKWRSDNMCAKALDYLAHNQQYIRWHDSDVMHAIVKNQWGEVDSRWNFWKEKSATPEEVKDAFIVHFMTKGKPWLTVEKNHEWHLFFHYLDLTDWSGFRPPAPTILRRIWWRLQREFKKLQSRFQ